MPRLTLLLAILILPAVLHSQLVFDAPIGPEGTSIAALAKDSTGILYAAGPRIFRSSDNGQHWTALGPAANWSSIGVTKNGILYAGTGNGGSVMRSTDQGQTWNYVGGIGGQSISCIAVDPLGRIYVGSNAGLFRSSNGTSFSYLQDVNQNIIHDMDFSLDGVYFAATMSGIFRSTDFGSSWSLLPSSLTNAFALRRLSSGQYLALMGQAVYRSQDRCVTWTKVAEGAFATHIAVMNDTVIIGGFGVLQRSVDGGTTWTDLLSRIPVSHTVALLAASPDLLLIGNNGGILRSFDRGWTWAPSNSGLGWISIRDFTVMPNGEYFAGSAAGVFKSTNSGSSWIPVNTGFSYQSIYMLEGFSDGMLFAGPDNGLYRSTNSGVTWQLMSAGIPEQSTEHISRLPSGTLLATQFFDLYRSTNGGDSWSKVLTDYNFGAPFNIVAGEDGAVYGTDGERIMRSIDDGRTWTERFRRFYRNADLITNAVGHFYVSDDYNGVFLSTDDGVRWTNVSPAPNGSHIRHLAVNRNGWVYFTNEFGEVYESQTNGRSWTQAAALGKQTSDMFIDHNGFLYVITPESGIYRSSVSTAPVPLPSLTVAPSVDAGRRRIQRRHDTLVTLANPGSGDISITIGGDSPNFSFGRSSLTIPAHSTVRETLSVSMPVIGPFAATFILSHNAAWQKDTVHVRAFGHGVPVIRFEPASIGFGSIERPHRKDAAVVLHNEGDDTLFITQKLLSPVSFQSRSLYTVVPQGRSVVDSLRFTPDRTGLFSGRMIVTSNTGSKQDTLPLAGSAFGFPQLWLQSPFISFGTVKVGAFKEVPLYLLNPGYDTLRINAFTPLDPVFTATPSSLPSVPENQYVFTHLRYAPVAPGRDSTLVIITSNTARGSDTVIVTGEAEDPAGTDGGEAVTSYVLEQNYPNPFNPSTTIVFRTPAEGPVSIRLYDPLGRLVRILLNSRIGKGEHDLEISSEGLASGMYLYELIAGPYRCRRKMMLVR